MEEKTKEIKEMSRMRKEFLLEQFKCEKEPILEMFGSETDVHSTNILMFLKEKELTYEQAYAVLELTYKKLKYESNFIFLKQD